MTNRERYFLKRDEYDLMLQIGNETEQCPIFVVGGQISCDKIDWFGYGEKCSECIQSWLNKEAD